MEKETTVTTRGLIFTVKNTCPYCHNFIEPVLSNEAYYDTKDGITKAALLFRCPACQKFFCVSYDIIQGIVSRIESTTKPNLNLNIPKEIETFSPKFVEIYTQALTAEYYNLHEITGIGLRKAIEFLVKDYLIQIKGKDKNKISKMNLGSAFKEIDNDMIRPLITASVWLGNDEAHYIRQHENKDVNDMKQFVESLIYFISCELKVKEALSFIASSTAK